MFIAYLDDDDTWRPDKLEKQVQVFYNNENEVGMVTCGVQHWNSDDVKKLGEWVPKHKGYVYQTALDDSSIIFEPPSAVMLRKNAIDKIGNYREDMKRGCCQQYFLCFSKVFPICFSSDILVDYNFHENAITTIQTDQDIINSIDALLVIINTIEDDLVKFPHMYSKKLINIAHLFALLSDKRNSIEYYESAKMRSSYWVRQSINLLIFSLKLPSNYIYEKLYHTMKYLRYIYKFYNFKKLINVANK